MATTHPPMDEQLTAEAFRARVAWVLHQARRVGIWGVKLVIRDEKFRRTLRQWRAPATDPHGTPVVFIPREGRHPDEVVSDIVGAVVHHAEGLTPEQRMSRAVALRRLVARQLRR